MKKKTRWESFKSRFKLQAIDETSFEEKFSIRTSALYISMFFLFFAALIASLTLVLFAYTPLNYLLPSWKDRQYFYQYKTMLSRLDSVEQMADRQQLFFTDLQKWLTGEALEEVLDTQIQVKTGRIEIPKHPADSALRKEMAGVVLMPDAELERYIAKLFLSNPVQNPYEIKPFDYGQKKYGIDLYLDPKTFVYSIAEGTVINAVFDIFEGYILHIQHPNNLISVYKNLGAILKKTGDVVAAQEPLGLSDLSSTEKTFIHFQLWDNGMPIDPEPYLSF